MKILLHRFDVDNNLKFFTEVFVGCISLYPSGDFCKNKTVILKTIFPMKSNTISKLKIQRVCQLLKAYFFIFLSWQSHFLSVITSVRKSLGKIV